MVLFVVRHVLAAPVVLVAALAFRRYPPTLADWVGTFSRWALLITIAPLSVKTSLPKIFKIGARAIGLLIGETVFLAVLFLLN